MSSTLLLKPIMLPFKTSTYHLCIPTPSQANHRIGQTGRQITAAKPSHLPTASSSLSAPEQGSLLPFQHAHQCQRSCCKAHLPAKQSQADEGLQEVAYRPAFAAVMHQAGSACDEARPVPQACACTDVLIKTSPALFFFGRPLQFALWVISQVHNLFYLKYESK